MTSPWRRSSGIRSWDRFWPRPRRRWSFSSGPAVPLHAPPSSRRSRGARFIRTPAPSMSPSPSSPQSWRPPSFERRWREALRSAAVIAGVVALAAAAVGGPPVLEPRRRTGDGCRDRQPVAGAHRRGLTARRSQHARATSDAFSFIQGFPNRSPRGGVDPSCRRGRHGRPLSPRSGALDRAALRPRRSPSSDTRCSRAASTTITTCR